MKKKLLALVLSTFTVSTLASCTIDINEVKSIVDQLAGSQDGNSETVVVSQQDPADNSEAASVDPGEVDVSETVSEQPSEQPSEEPSSAPASYGTLKYDPTQQTTVKIYTTISATKAYGLAFDRDLERFSELYPNINVDHERVGSYDDIRDKLKTELSTGSGPNLAWCYPDHVALYNVSKSVQSLDKFIYNEEVDEQGNLLYGLTEEQREDFISAYWEEGKSYGDGLMYSLPFSKSTEVLYYNKTEFEANNLEVPTHWFKDDEGLDPTTSLEYVCEKFKEIYPSDRYIPFGYDSEANWFITLTEQYESGYTALDKNNHFLFDNAKNRQFVSKLKEMYDKGYFTTQSIYGSYTSALFTNADEAKPTSFMCIGSSAGANNQYPADERFEVGVAPIPQINPNNPKVISQGPNVCMFKKSSQEMVASWLLLKYLTTNVEVQATYSINSGYVPVINSVYENDVYLEFLDGASGYTNGVIAASAVACREQSESYYTSPAFVGSSAARTNVGKLLVSVLNGTDIDEAFRLAVEESEKELI